MEEIADHKFMKLLHEGDENTFQSIYERYFAALCSYSNSYVGDMQAASDIVQDAFVALWRLRFNFTSQPSLRSFLYVTTRNASLNHIKHNKVQINSLGALNQEMMEIDAAQLIISTEVERQLIESMESLPKECRNVLKLSIEGKTYKEIGAIMHIAVSTVRNHRIRAVKMLKLRFSKVV